MGQKAVQPNTQIMALVNNPKNLVRRAVQISQSKDTKYRPNKQEKNALRQSDLLPILLGREPVGMDTSRGRLRDDHVAPEPKPKERKLDLK